MTRATQKQRIEFIKKITEHCPKLGEIPWEERYRELQLLLRRGASYGTIQELWCNEQMSERREAQVIKREKNLEKKIAEFLAKIDAKPIFGGDPRGNTVKIVCPDGYSDDWGNTGLCLVTS